jgi:hypothetical protein
MNIQKINSVFIAFFLLVSNTGVAFNVHYCADTIASISLFENASANEIEENCCGVVEEQSNCCHNKIIKSESKSDQVLLDSFDFDMSFFILVAAQKSFQKIFQNNFKETKINNYCFNANAPPIFERNCQRIFYA